MSNAADDFSRAFYPFLHGDERKQQGPLEELRFSLLEKARESVEDISLSPDGRRIAYLAPQQGQGSALYTVDLASGQSTLTTGVDGRIQRLNSCTWSASDRLVCWVFGLRWCRKSRSQVSGRLLYNAG